MVRRRALLSLPFVVPVVVACQPSAAPLTEADHAAIREVHVRFTRYALAGQADSLGLLYTEDAVVMPPNMPAATGRAAIVEFNRTFPPVSSVELTIDDVSGYGDLAYVRGTYRVTIAVEGSPVDTGKYIEIRRRQADGTWLMAVDMFNSNLPAVAH
ncbi:MAG: nuclear transport factor 2 family protein [Gemmatimonadales bacterium]